MKTSPKPAYTIRNIVGLISILFDKKTAYNELKSDPHSFYDAREEAYADVCEAENNLTEALVEVLKP